MTNSPKLRQHLIINKNMAWKDVADTGTAGNILYKMLLLICLKFHQTSW